MLAFGRHPQHPLCFLTQLETIALSISTIFPSLSLLHIILHNIMLFDHLRYINTLSPQNCLRTEHCTNSVGSMSHR